MNVNKLLTLFILLPFIIFSQKKDAYFIINKDSNEYLLKTQGGQIDEFNYKMIKLFIFYNRIEYEKFNKKNDVLYSWGNKIPKTSFFDVKKIEKKLLEHCEIHQLEIIDYNWLIKNSWKENNPNILFNNLYFLIKTRENKFIKLKVNRTIIEY
jgi:hypothetical protein